MAKEFKFEIQWMSPESLTPYVNNTKKHPTEQIDLIAQQIAKFGFDQPIVVNKDKVIIKGHGRREASVRLGLSLVPVIVREDIGEFDEMALRMADNRVAQSEWDNEMLGFELATLFRNDYDLVYTGFDDSEIKELLEANEIPDEDIIGSGSGNPPEIEKQYIVSVECKSEEEMAALYTELKNRGLNCTLIA